MTLTQKFILVILIALVLDMLMTMYAVYIGLYGSNVFGIRMRLIAAIGAVPALLATNGLLAALVLVYGKSWSPQVLTGVAALLYGLAAYNTVRIMLALRPRL